MHRPLLILPTYNESDTLAALLGMLGEDARVDVLVIDDNSPDGTGALADALAKRLPWVRVLHRASKLGLGSAYREGMALALAEGRPAVLEMDSDFSHDPRDVPRLLRGLDRADLVIGTRTLPGGGTPGWPLYRRLISQGGNLYARVWLGLAARDLTSGFRAYRGEALRKADPTHTRSDGYAFQVEMAFRISQSGGRIGEVPIVFADRRIGKSKLSRRIVWEAARRMPALALERLVRRAETAPEVPARPRSHPAQ